MKSYFNMYLDNYLYEVKMVDYTCSFNIGGILLF